MFYLFLYVIGWLLACFLGAIYTAKFDPKDEVQVLALVICCMFWPVMLVCFLTSTLSEFVNDRF